ncbi:hypothetical protein BHE74_00024885 [Ensete ventricosum]|nr:hypothetical protein GW17_00054662 [Ensete ventricosum]RWW67646.1 hypothetical protein BHE74_00024885 [Ensete ventricosum]RZR91984.1 hypothetical protein BHM03_00020209 [Ensete ventricosum]
MKELAAAREGHSAVKQPAVAAGKKKPVEEHTAGTAERYAKQSAASGRSGKEATALPCLKSPIAEAITGSNRPLLPARRSERKEVTIPSAVGRRKHKRKQSTSKGKLSLCLG